MGDQVALDQSSAEAMLADELKRSDTAPGAKLLLTVSDAAWALSLGRTQVYELLGDGRLPSVRIGRSRRIRVSDLETFVASAAGGF